MLQVRKNDGCSNAHQLFQELQEKGYRGGETTVRSFVTRLRKGLSGMARPPKQGGSTCCSNLTKRTSLAALKARRGTHARREKSDLTRLLEVSQEVKQVYQLLQSFLHMLRERQPERLNGMDEGSM